jgi:hypothetical protein
MDYDGYQGLAQALFEESGDALILFDSRTKRVRDVNAAAQRLCGIGLRDLLNTPVSDLFRCGRGGMEATAFPARKVHLPFDEWGCHLRTVQDGVWVSVDVTVTRLAVSPWPLVLLTLRRVPGGGCRRGQSEVVGNGQCAECDGSVTTS